MLELLTLLLSVWLMVKVIGLTFRLTWGMAKVLASVLMILAVPALFVCLLFIGGVALLIPLALVVMAFGIAKACV